MVQDHWSETALSGGRAAEVYEESHKRKHRNTERRCQEEGLQFRPIVFEHQGGMSKEADATIRAIAKAVAGQEKRDHQTIRKEMLERIAVITSRATHYRIRRRAFRRGSRREDTSRAVRNCMLEAVFEDADLVATGMAVDTVGVFQ